MTRITGADAVLRSLEAEAVEVAFGLPGGAVLPIYDAVARGTSVRHVLARHEQGAGHMAEGYARASGRVGVALATSGPGATNLVTPIADAWMDSTPLVCVTGQVRSHLIGTDAFQECDIVGVTTPIVKHSWLVQDVEEIPHVLKAAFHVARTGRCGPVLVDIPRDIQEAELDFRYPEEVELPGWRPPRRGHSRQIAEAARRIAAAERPVLYVGGGTLNADACAELLELAEVGRLPVVTTLMAKSAFPETHELHFGWPGMHGPKWSNLAMNTCDLLIAVGARFDDRVTGKLSAFAPGATVVHLDIDAAEIGKLRRADVPVVGPLKQVLAELAEQLAAVPGPETEPWLRLLEAWREEFPLRYGNGGSLKPQRVVEALQRLTADRDDVIWTTGVGQHQMWAMQYLRCDRPRTFITSGGLGTMGYGLPAAIGAKAARPDATVVCIDGDGSFQMTGQELATAVAEDLPIVTVVVNNSSLGMVQQWQTMFFDERHSHVRLAHALPDLAALARAYGAEGFTVEEEDELEGALAEALACGRTAVVDARVDPLELCFPMIPAGAAALDMVEYDPEAAEAVSVTSASWDADGKGGAARGAQDSTSSTDKRRGRRILPPGASGDGGGLRPAGAVAGQGGEGG
jgi:acetolactate synthase I/II/III large subunit